MESHVHQSVVPSCGAEQTLFYESFESLDVIAGAVIDLSAKVIYIAFTTLAEGNQAKLPNLPLAQKSCAPYWVICSTTRVAHAFCSAKWQQSRGQSQPTPRHRYAGQCSVELRAYSFTKRATKPIRWHRWHHRCWWGGTIEAILNWLDGGIPLTRDEFIDDMATLWNVNGDTVASIALQRKQT